MVRFALVLIACSRTSAPPVPVSPDPVDAAAPPATVAKVAPKDADVPARCENDKDCDYDDPCNAHACVAKTAPFVGCDKSLPPPGRCVCANNECTLVRKAPKTVALKTGCTKNAECEFRPSEGTCAAGKGTYFIERRGGFCTCDAGTCTPDFVDTIPCKSNADCSLQQDPLRPAASSIVPRPYPPITPCKGGERDSVCVKGVCEIRVWKC